MTDEMKAAIARADELLGYVLKRPAMFVKSLAELESILSIMLAMRSAFLDGKGNKRDELRELAAERKFRSGGALGPTHEFRKNRDLRDPDALDFYTEWVRRARENMDKDT